MSENLAKVLIISIDFHKMGCLFDGILEAGVACLSTLPGLLLFQQHVRPPPRVLKVPLEGIRKDLCNLCMPAWRWKDDGNANEKQTKQRRQLFTFAPYNWKSSTLANLIHRLIANRWQIAPIWWNCHSVHFSVCTFFYFFLTFLQWLQHSCTQGFLEHALPIRQMCNGCQSAPEECIKHLKE